LELLKDGNDDEAVDIFGPYELQENVDGECHWEDWGTFGYESAIAEWPEIEEYDIVMFILPWVTDPEADDDHRINGCGFGGQGSVGGKASWVNHPTAGVMIHELNHSLGLVGIPDPGDPTDMMGTARVVGLNAPSMLKLEFLTDAHVVEIDSNDTVVLLPLYVDPYDFPGTRVVKISVPGRDPYYISFRDDSGIDEYLATENKFAGFVHTWDGNQTITPIERIKADDTFFPTNGSFSVEVTDISEGAQHWEMEIEVTFLPTGTLAWQPFDWRLFR
jgi:hypothetical protein